MTTNGTFPKVRQIYHAFYVQNKFCTSACNVIKCWKWDISYITHNQSREGAKYAVLILNRPISQHPDFIKDFWNNATIRVTVDGGTVHWDTFLSKLSDSEQQNMRLPDLITGDFDSVKNDVLQKYKKQGCKVVHTPNQDHTDFTKALMVLEKHCKEHDIELKHAVAICQNSGRIDQCLGNIHTMHLVREKNLLNPNIKLYILTDDSISWLLWPGDHVIDVPEETKVHKRTWCSLVPVGEPCLNITTSGLKWNLANELLKFGVLVSTSNTFDGSKQVKIKCSHPLLWSMKIPSLQGGVSKL